MGSTEQDGYNLFKEVYEKDQPKFDRALEKASDNKRMRDAILSQRYRDCERIFEFCGEVALNIQGKSAQEHWLKEANRWEARTKQLQRMIDENDADDGDDEELPLPDQKIGKDGKPREIKFY